MSSERLAFKPAQQLSKESKPLSHDPRAVANEIVRLAAIARSRGHYKDHVLITAAQIDKLVYYIYARLLYAHDHKLIAEQPLIGKFGPYFDTLSRALNDYGNEPLIHLLTDSGNYNPYWRNNTDQGTPFQSEFTSWEKEAVAGVWNGFVEQPLLCHNLSALIKGNEDNWVTFHRESQNLEKFGMTDEDVRHFFELSFKDVDGLSGDSSEVSRAA